MVFQEVERRDRKKCILSGDFGGNTGKKWECNMVEKKQHNSGWINNRQKWKSILHLITIGITVLLLTGCHGVKEQEGFQIPEEFDATKDYEITFWAKNDTNKAQTEIYANAIESFQSLYPNIHVNMRLYTNYADIYNDVITNIATKTTPNVCITYPDHIATYLTGNNVVVPLDSLFKDTGYGLGGDKLKFDSVKEEEILPEFLDECKIAGKYYAIPYMRSTEACYINKTYVEKLGYEVPETLTWDFVWEVSEAAMEKEGENFALNGQNVMIPFIYKSTDNMMISMLRQLDAPYSTEEGEILLFNDTTKELLSTIAKHAKTKAFSTFKISSYPANFLNAGQCIFAVDSTAGSTWMGSDAPLCDISEDKLVQFETVVRRIPQFDTKNPQMISQGPSICVFNKDDKQEVLASWMFAQFLLTNEVQIAYAQTEGYVPVTSKARESQEYQEYLAAEGTDNELHYDIKLQASKLLLDNVDNTFITPVFNGSASLRNAAEQLVEATVKAERRKQTVDDNFYNQLFAETISLYRLDQINTGGQKRDLGPMPATAIVLIAALIVAWICIICYVILQKIRKTGKIK